MATAGNAPPGPALVPQLHQVLERLSTTPYPVVTTETTKKRASVALIVRLSPSYGHWPPDTANPSSSNLSDFFSQPWAAHAEPEVLFIKRASRKGDRWTSHIALPGGRRDPEDDSDQAAAIRETSEEVGIDLEQHALGCGNLPQRLVTTHWGKTPLMTLCPYVFLLTTHALPPLRLQPTEVASTHWVPLRSLLSPAQRTVVGEDVSSRLANHETGVKKWMLSLILGKMTFAAINLAPTESLHSFESPAPTATTATPPSRLSFLSSTPLPPPPSPPLLLWGLTLGVIADFLDLLPPHNALTLWTYPTFSPWDVRLAIYLLTYNFKHRKRAELQAGTTVPSSYTSSHPIATQERQDDSSRRSFGAATESMVFVDRPSSADGSGKPDETGLHGLGTGVGEHWSKKAAVATLLEGYVESFANRVLPSVADRGRYYDIVRRAVAVALAGRAGLVLVVAVLVWRKLKARRRR